jgi:uncharacterized protein with HXXEE motif
LFGISDLGFRIYAYQVKFERSTLSPWYWFFPISLPIHIAEEFWGGEGFLSWNVRATGAVLSVTKFFTLVGIGFALVLTGILLARHYPKMRWIISALATIFLINGFSHLIATFSHHRYSPGLISGLLLWIPFSIWILIAEHRKTTRRTFVGGIITGAAIHGVVTLFSRGIV